MLLVLNFARPSQTYVKKRGLIVSAFLVLSFLHEFKKIPFIKGSLEEFEIFEGKLVELTGQLFRNCEVTSGTVEPKKYKTFTDNKSN